MSLAPGTRLGVYSILGPLGAGGMGEVYRARDTQLDRQVAVKILPEAFAADPDRLMRFTREAKTLAALNHPKIAHVHGLEHSSGVHALVMELVEGEDLSQVIARGPLPLAQAMAIARQVAEALEAAHERGIVHRDLKPANIKVTADGGVKVLDFGLAKALDPTDASSPDVMNSPTLTMRATEVGVILGTAAYMAPEQARGKAVDRRADVWALGVILYEMLTGRRAFEGSETTDLLASVLKDTPSFRSLPPDTPPAIHRLLRRALEKDPARRLDSMAAVRLEIDEALAPATDAVPVAPVSTRSRAAWILLAAIASLAAVGGYLWRGAPAATPLEVTRMAVVPGADAPLGTDGNAPDIALSADGRRVIYRVAGSGEDGVRRLASRPLDAFEPTPLAGLGLHPGAPFVSPDGAWFGFETTGARLERVLAKAPSAGGPLVVLCALDSLGGLRGASWGDDDWIVFGVLRTVGGLLRIPASGGTPEAVTTPDQTAGERSHVWPHVLPDGAGILFAIARLDATFDVAVLPRGAQTWRVLVRGGTAPRYVPGGHLIYASAGVLYGVGFDLARLDVTTEPMPLVDGVLTKLSGAANYALAGGTLAYVPGGLRDPLRSLVWVDRGGRVEPLPLEPRAYRPAALSPDAGRVAVMFGERGSSSIWTHDVRRGTFTRLTPRSESARDPVWSPDGRRIAFWSDDGQGLFTMAADGSDSPARLTRSERGGQVPNTWSPDGTTLVFIQQPDLDLYAVPVAPPHDVRPLVVGQGARVEAAFSPDGRWLAYVAFEAGMTEVVVGRAASPDSAWPIAVSGRYPIWSADGRNVFFRDGDAIRSVPIDPETGRPLGQPAEVLALPPRLAGMGRLSATADASRFLLLEEAEESGPSEIRVVLNWTEEVRATMTSAAPVRR